MRSRPRIQQTGAALLVAMVVLTLVTTLAAGLVWQQWRAIQVEAAERSRAQSAWMLSGAADWARLILREDLRTPGGVDDLTETWAVPLAEARLSSFLAADPDRNAETDGPQAFLSGRILDLQSRYNLRRLQNRTPADFDIERKVLRRLAVLAGMSPAEADSLAQRLALAWDDSAPDAPLRPDTVDQLAWLGMPPQQVAQLSQWATILPRADTQVNVNTASKEVLLGVIDGLDAAAADRLIARRQSAAFKNLSEVEALVPPAVKPLDQTRLAVGSSHFEVLGQLRLDERLLRERTVVLRDAGSRRVQRLSTERVPLLVDLEAGAAPLR